MNTYLNQMAEETLSSIRDRLAIEMNQKDKIATGKAVGSLRVEGNKLYGTGYIEQLVFGRRPGKFPPVQNIRDWVRIKLRVDEKEVNSVAYLVGRKIAQSGTGAYMNESERVDLTKIVKEEISNMIRKLPAGLANYTKQFGIAQTKWH